MRRLLLGIALAVPVASFAQTDLVGYLRGGATLNGNPATTQSVALNSGDTILTNSGSAYVTGTGSSINLPRNTSAMFRDRVLRVGCGSAGVVTKTGLKAKVSGIDVTPAGSNAQYSLITRDGEVTISALQGALDLSNGAKTFRLSSGRAIKVDAVCVADPAQDGEVAEGPGPFGAPFEMPRPTYASSPVALAAVGASTAAVIIAVLIAVNEGSAVR